MKLRFIPMVCFLHSCTSNLTADLYASFQFSGDITDVSKNPRITENYGATLTADRFDVSNSAVHFNTGAKVEILNSPSLDIGTGDYSISAWFKREVLGGNQYIFVHSMSGCSEAAAAGYALAIGSDNRVVGRLSCDNQCTYSQSTSVFTSTTQWFHVTHTVERGVAAKIYVNGRLENTVSTVPFCDATQTSSGFFIGYDFLGDIDDLRIYTRAISQEEVNFLYALDQTDGLIAHFPFTNNAEDATGYGHIATVNGVTLTQDRFGVPNSAYHFSAGSSITIANSLDLEVGTGDFSISVWIKRDSWGGKVLIFGHGTEDCVVTGYSLYLTSDNKVAGYYVCSEIAGCTVGTSTNTIAVDMWNHIAYTVQRGIAIKIYINGVLDSATNVAPACTVTNVEEGFMVGQHVNSGNEQFLGDMDEFRFYNRAISDTEVRKLYFDEQPSSQPSRQPSGQPTGQPTRQPSGQPSIRPTQHPTSQPSSTIDLGLVLHLPFNNDTTDYSVNHHVTSAADGAVLVANRFGVNNKAYRFTANTYITVTGSPQLQIGIADVTFSAWIKLSTTITYARLFHHGGYNCSSNGYAFLIIANKLSYNYICTTCESATSTAAMNIPFGVWAIVTVVIKRGISGTFYYNGVARDSTTNAVACDMSRSYNPVVGAFDISGTEQFLGDIDDLRVYNRALTAVEVQDLYSVDQPSGLIAYFPFTRTYIDESGYGHSTVLNGAMRSQDRFGVQNRALHFVNTNYISVSSSTLLNIGVSDFTVSAWIKPSTLGRYGRIFSKGAGDCDLPGYMLRIDNDNVGRLEFGGVSPLSTCNIYYVTTLKTFALSEWHLLTATVSRKTSSTKIYFDGVLDGFVSAPILIDLSSSAPGYIGAFNNLDSETFLGEIDDLRIYNTALSDDAVRDLYFSDVPSSQPSGRPSDLPTSQPTSQPSVNPSVQPNTWPSSQPSHQPSSQPPASPSQQPSLCPSSQPSAQPSRQPSSQPTGRPVTRPSSRPSRQPSQQPSRQPSQQPLVYPSSQPSLQPSRQPSSQPISWPTTIPRNQPTSQPSRQPLMTPSTRPSRQPSSQPSTAPSLMIVKGLVAHFPFDANFADITGNNIVEAGNAVIHATDRNGRTNGAFNFTSNNYIQLRYNSLLDFGTDDFSISIWIKHDAGSSQMRIFSHGLSSCSSSGYSLLLEADMKVYLYLSCGEHCLTPIAKSTTVTLNNVWYFVTAAVQRGQAVKIFINGHLEDTREDTSTCSVANSIEPILIGASNSHWCIDMDDLKIYNRAITEAEVQTLYYNQQPSSQPSSQPTVLPSSQPYALPSLQPSSQPGSAPSSYPSAVPSYQPSVHPSKQPSLQPVGNPTRQPINRPSLLPSEQPSTQPVMIPTAQPSRMPTSTPSTQPNPFPSSQPSNVPSMQPNGQPFIRPTAIPTSQPWVLPTRVPSCQPIGKPSAQPSSQLVPLSSTEPHPSPQSTHVPSPNEHHDHHLSKPQSIHPTYVPSYVPSECSKNSEPSFPSRTSTVDPCITPSTQPGSIPSAIPSNDPSFQPSSVPSSQPTTSPTAQPSDMPSRQPVGNRTGHPSMQPPTQPIVKPSSQPLAQPSSRPTRQPQSMPTSQPSAQPFSVPTSHPSGEPTRLPSQATGVITSQPTFKPSLLPAVRPPPSLPQNTVISVMHKDSNVTAVNVKFKIVLPFMFVLAVAGDGLRDVILSKATSGINYFYMGTNVLVNRQLSVSELKFVGPAISFDFSGRSVSAAGDVNGDTYPDLIIGVPYASRCYVLFGTQQGFVNMTSGITFLGANPSDLTGWSVSSAGDINNDTLADIIIGAPNGGTDSSGAAYVIYGREVMSLIDLTNLPESDGFAIYGAEAQDCLGLSVSGAGDVNGDGFDDLVVGALKANELFAGAVYILYGGSTQSLLDLSISLSISQGHAITGPAWSWFGYSVSGVGDVNSDGYADMVIGSVPRRSAMGTQLTYIIFGGPTLTAVVEARKVSPSQGLIIIGGGVSVSGVGDLNGDGFGDVMIGSDHGFDSEGGYVVMIPSDLFRVQSLTPIAVQSMSPTRTPSKKPTMKPSVTPSVTPSLNPTQPTLVPSVAPSGPTMLPSIEPTQPSSVPSSAPTTPSVLPSLTPSEIRSTTPLIMACEGPSDASCTIPTVLPSTTWPSTESPTFRPTFTVTRDPTWYPVVRPTMLPTTLIVANATYEQIVVRVAQVRRDNASYINYVLNETDRVIFVGTGSICLFTVFPINDSQVTIDRFNTTSDVINFEAFRFIQSMSDLNITRALSGDRRYLRAEPSSENVRIQLKNRQSVDLLQIRSIDLTAKNFRFASAQPYDDSVTITEESQAVRIIGVVCGSAIVAYILYEILYFCWNKNRDWLGRLKPVDWDAEGKNNKTYLSWTSSDSDTSLDTDYSAPSPPTSEHDSDAKNSDTNDDENSTVDDSKESEISLGRPIRSVYRSKDTVVTAANVLLSLGIDLEGNILNERHVGDGMNDIRRTCIDDAQSIPYRQPLQTELK